MSVLLLLPACKGKDPQEPEQTVHSYKVAVVLPASEKAEPNYRKMLVVLETCYSGSVAETCEGLPGITLYDLYVNLAKKTTGSHAGIYNWLFYGSVYRNSFKEYLP